MSSAPRRSRLLIALVAVLAVSVPAGAANAQVPGGAPAGTTDPAPAGGATDGGVTEGSADDPIEIDPGPQELPRMSAYDASAFLDAAAALPAELGEAIERDLGDTPEEYLARTAAAVEASDVVEGLVGAGVAVLGSRLEGTQLVVNVPDEAAAAVVTEVGATPELGEPVVPDHTEQKLQALADLVGGQAFQFIAAGLTYVCTAGFVGRYGPYPQPQFVTSGHCIEPDRDSGNYFYESRQSRAGASPSRGSIIGAPVDTLFRFGSGADVGVVNISPDWTPTKRVSTWGGGAGALGDSSITLTDLTTGIVGSPLCKSGRTTGWTCGTILVTNESYPVYDRSGSPEYVNLTLTDVCMLPGDSGAAAVIGTAAFGIGSAGTFSGSCNTAGQPDAISAFFPMLTSDGTKSVSNTIPEWQLTVDVRTPTVVRPSFVGDSIRGTLPGAGPRHRVVLTIDSTSYLITPNAAGAWSFAIPSALQSGSHTFTVTGRWGDFSTSATLTDSYRLQPKPTVERVTGADRYASAVQISQRAFPGTAATVYVATGQNYPDALSSVPAAVREQAPLLLTPTDQLLPAVSAEISRLKPTKIVVVGGSNSVSESVLGALRSLVGTTATVVRYSGADRYEASRNLAAAVFPEATRGFVATGSNFPDALSTGSAAGSANAPIVLVYGPATTADEPTLALFRTSSMSKITISGGTNSVSPGVASALGTVATVNRLTGPDRFATSIAVNRAAYSTSSTVYLATGLNYPDALAGSVLAGRGKAPLYIVPTDCVPRGVIADITSLKASKVVLLGGTNSLSAEVQQLAACGW